MHGNKRVGNSDQSRNAKRTFKEIYVVDDRKWFRDGFKNKTLTKLISA